MTRVALVSCVKSKRATPAPAQDLYTSALFAKLRRYAEGGADAWYILSAEHGLVHPDQVLAPYERTVNKMKAAERKEWATRVQQQLAFTLPPGCEVVVLAGERYREGLLPFLRARGHRVEAPLAGLPLGLQLQYLDQEAGDGDPAAPPGEPAKRPLGNLGAQPRTRRLGRPHAALSELTSRSAVLQAIEEFDRVGRDAFLAKYGYKPAKRYFLEHRGQRYDSKAIVGVAFGYQFPARGPLTADQFSGGERTVQRRLEELGFTLAVTPA